MKKGNWVLLIILCISIGGNAFLFKRVVDWQDAWSEQIVTTSQVEQLFIKSGADVSFEGLEKLVGEQLGEYKIIQVVPSDNLWFGSDDRAILAHGTKLFFKENVYIGSKANLPPHLAHWGFNTGDF